MSLVIEKNLCVTECAILDPRKTAGLLYLFILDALGWMKYNKILFNGGITLK